MRKLILEEQTYGRMFVVVTARIEKLIATIVNY